MSDLHAEPPPDSNAELEVPEDVRRATIGSSSSLGCIVLGAALAFSVVVYFGFFGLLVLDELILETHYVSTTRSQELVDAVLFIYGPMIFLVNWLMYP